MAERTKATDLKSVVGLPHRGFESLSLRLGEVPEWSIGAAC